MTQSWNFAAIESAAGTIGAQSARSRALLDEGEASLSKLADVWGGSGSEQYLATQRRWDGASKELNAALQNLQARINESAQTMALTDKSIGGTFGG